jgi:hypothetical protein
VVDCSAPAIAERCHQLRGCRAHVGCINVWQRRLMALCAQPGIELLLSSGECAPPRTLG